MYQFDDDVPFDEKKQRYDVPFDKNRQRYYMPFNENEQRCDVPFLKDQQEGVSEVNLQKKTIHNWQDALIRAIGLILLLIGLGAGIQVLLEALKLYRDPYKIEQLSHVIEQAFNPDKNLSKTETKETDYNSGKAIITSLNYQSREQEIHLSYFVAWIIALLILMLLSMIAFSFIRAGSELVLQDRQMKSHVHLLIKELRDFKKREN